MNDWRESVILDKLAQGCTMKEAATAASMTRQGVWWRCGIRPDFAQAVALARETGKDERTYRLWLRHPFRGCRPPTGKGNSGTPRFAYGRR